MSLPLINRLAFAVDAAKASEQRVKGLSTDFGREFATRRRNGHVLAGTIAKALRISGAFLSQLENGKAAWTPQLARRALAALKKREGARP